MNSDEQVIYNAVHNAWLARLREVNLDVTSEFAILKQEVYELALLMHVLARELRKIQDGPHSTDTPEFKTKESMAGMASTADDTKPKSMAEPVRATRSSAKVKSKTSFMRRRA